MIQDIVSSMDRKDAADIKSLTSPAAIPLRRYTGSNIAKVIPIA
jgi:hypothetical protein